MPYRYKIDVLQRLKEKGYSTYKLRNEKLLASSTIQKLRDGDTNITMETLETLSNMLECKPTDIIDFN